MSNRSALNRQEADQFIDQVAAAIRQRGLRLPALLALQAGHPLTFLGGQLLWVAQPALSLFMPTTAVRQMAHVLEEPKTVAQLIARLETEEA